MNTGGRETAIANGSAEDIQSCVCAAYIDNETIEIYARVILYRYTRCTIGGNPKTNIMVRCKSKSIYNR